MLTQQVDDELDILEANIDPADIKSLVKRAKLEEEIEMEKRKMKAKFVMKFALQESDPLKIWSW